MSALVAWPEYDWRNVYRRGSPSAAEYKAQYLSAGSGQAALSAENARLNKLEARVFKQNVDGSRAISPPIIAAARQCLRAFYAASANTAYGWSAPHITIGSEGEAIFEWWNGERKITIYIGNTAIEYIKVWGPNIDEDMESGELSTGDDFRLIWNWLRAVCA